MNEAIALQEAAGIDMITDGEMRRYSNCSGSRFPSDGNPGSL
jgi:hypothetical protein